MVRLLFRFLIVMALVATAAQGQSEPALYTIESPLPVEDVGTPIRTARRAGDFLVPKPGGKGWFFITSFGKRVTPPVQMYVVDLDTGAVKKHEFPRLTDMISTGIVGRDGKAYICAYCEIGMFIFDPATEQVEYVSGNLGFRITAFQMTQASNGEIIMGTASGRALVVSFDPATKTFRNYGVQGPDHSGARYIFSMSVNDDYIYSAAGKNPWYLVALNRITGEQVKLIDEKPDYLDVSGSSEGKSYARVTRNFRKPNEEVDHYLLEAGKATKIDGPPKMTPEELAAFRERRDSAEKAKPRIHAERARVDSRGVGELWWRYSDDQPWRSTTLEGVNVYPWTIATIGKLPDGRIMGLPREYEDAFIYDPRSSKFEVLGKSPLSGSFVAGLGDKAYLIGYPGTYLAEYDPAKPWTYYTSTTEKKEPALESIESNPRKVEQLGTHIQTHHARGYQIGADGCLYVSGHAERLHVGGGIAWFDPKTGQTGGLREPFRVYDCAAFGLASTHDGGTLLYSGAQVTDPSGALATPATTALFVVDVRTRSVTDRIDLPAEWKSPGPIAARGDRVYGAAVLHKGGASPAALWCVDLKSKSVVEQQPLPAPLYSDLVFGPDGKLYGAVGGKALVRIDPQNLSVTALTPLTDGGNILFVGDDVYLSGEANLRRIAGVAKR